ncbi:MAG: undecaprenyl/decaprenyl-phosphate alpha-N-acetylglucosaminyl 1-phosphate transferase [Chloroflexi bacterium]|nr:undecaprenyl/decaprenyl-phosphate alpha-N-acetylglucosaminyl 1-phosphate transferase [Chloroflexota bacterium]
MTYLLQYLLVGASTALLALVLTPIAGRIAGALGIADAPGGRRRHSGIVPRLGGVPIFLACVVIVVITMWTGDLTIGYSPGDYLRLRGLLTGGVLAFLFGLVDDRFELPAWPQFIFQFTLSLVALATTLWLERFTLPGIGYVALDSYRWGALLFVPLTVLWTMGMMNTVNWLDGLDGLAAGVGAIVCLVLAVHMHRVGQFSVALLPVALLGALVGFLPYNVSPARVFLGSSGAFFLGYALSALGLIAGGRIATVLLVMGVPIVDVAWQIFDRVRHHRSPTQGDRGHLHLRLLDAGISKRTIVLLYWGVCVLLGLVALFVASRLCKLIALVAIIVAVVSVLAHLSRSDRSA